MKTPSKPKGRKSRLEETLDLQLQIFAPYEREYRFHPIRKWRFDFAWPEYRIAVEIEGGIFVRGRHSRGAGIRADCEKYNQAAIMGWTVLRYTDREVKNGKALEEISMVITDKKSKPFSLYWKVTDREVKNGKALEEILMVITNKTKGE